MIPAKILQPALVLLFYLSIAFLSAPKAAPAQKAGSPECSVDEPGVCDYIYIGLAGTTALALNVITNEFGPHESRWKEPPAFDLWGRTALKWTDSTQVAAQMSDYLLYSTIASPFITAFFTPNDYFRKALMSAEAFIYTVALTDLFKRMFARQRPYARFGDITVAGPGQNLSFFSGHTSTAFAGATMSALLLADAFPEWSWLIYPSFFIPAAATGYMRIAADRHYLTDVLAGAGAGTLISLLVYHQRKPWFIATPVPGGVNLTLMRRF